jgi:hypothetical protein
VNLYWNIRRHVPEDGTLQTAIISSNNLNRLLSVIETQCEIGNKFLNIVTYRPIARQRISKHACLTIEAVFSVWSVQNGYKEVFGSMELVVKNWVEF